MAVQLVRNLSLGILDMPWAEGGPPPAMLGCIEAREASEIKLIIVWYWVQGLG